MRIAVVTPVPASGEVGGAEALYRGLVRSLREAGHEVDPVTVVSDESSFETMLETYLRCYDLDLGGYDAVISTKGPSYMVRHPRHVAYLLHTPRVFYDLFGRTFGKGTREHHRQRATIQALDRHGLHPGRVTAHFAIGRTPVERLRAADPAWNDVPFEAVHPPPDLRGFRKPARGEHVLVPGRLHRWKRVDLVIEAFRRADRDVPLKIVGAGEDESRLRRLASGDPRIEMLGRVSDEELLDLYARAIVVPFVPIEEDYGYVTIESFLARKPVITATDSGEPVRFVQDGVNGFVVPPEPDALAARLAALIDDPDRAAALGERGPDAIRPVTWSRVVERLLEPLRARAGSRTAAAPRPLRVVVTDNQPIDPPEGGGRLRLLGLYGTLREGIDATYVGTYDWPGPGPREQRLTPRLREVDVPLSAAHFELDRALRERLAGRTTIDVALPWTIGSSPGLVERLRREVSSADVVVFSHPWMYRAVREDVRSRAKPVVYDAHNCEGRLRRALLGDSPEGRALADGVCAVERELCRESDRILACSPEDRDAFVEDYGVAPERIAVVPNGTDVATVAPASAEERRGARERLGLRPDAFVALFVGSAWPPNAEAVREIAGRLAPALLDVTFLVAGGAGEGIGETPPNVVTLGHVDDERRRLAGAAADVAVNPMRSGSGVNVKMLDAFAAGLPVVTTPVGARGLEPGDGPAFLTGEPEELSGLVARLRGDPALRARMAAGARRLAEERYDWREISGRVGDLLRDLARAPRRPATRPWCSVVVPTWERPERLARLLDALDAQTFRDFEVILVDQSREPASPETLARRFELRYVRTGRRGAVRARELGLAHARGDVVAFTDDDCLPDPEWLAHAEPYFHDARVVGVEGLVACDQDDAARYRIVTNVGFEGFGFMTANLFLRRDVIGKIGGFDERFEDPHFREDTDLAWRALAHGRIPFAHDVRVLHPAPSRELARESSAERTRFFVHDALLFDKHPARYVRLLRAEGHHRREPAFWETFMRGMIRHRVSPPVERLGELAGAEELAMLRELAARLAGEAAP